MARQIGCGRPHGTAGSGAAATAGNVGGTEYVETSGVTKSIPVTGSYAVAADGSGTLTLNTRIVTEDSPAPAVAAVYDFPVARSGASRRDSTSDGARSLP